MELLTQSEIIKIVEELLEAAEELNSDYPTGGWDKSTEKGKKLLEYLNLVQIIS